jgi:hypothetical protein
MGGGEGRFLKPHSLKQENDMAHDWQQFTKRTDHPKLGWLRKQLDAAGIPNRIEGESFWAPILQVPAENLDAAYDILYPVDDIPDNDPQFA